MSSALTPTLTVTSRIRIRRRRELPLAGEVVVQVGDIVTGAEMVARTQVEGELRLVRVAEILGIPAGELAQAQLVHEGSEVKEGDIIAEVRGLWGLFRSTCNAPISGKVEFISTTTGHVGIRAPSTPLNLSAYISGRVVEVERERAVVIESEATFVQGIFGVGGERLGSVRVLPVMPDAQITELDIPDSAVGSILVGGHSPTIGALRKAVAAGAVGFITGSIDDQALRDYVGYDIGVALTGDEDLSMTLIITEGFGALPMSERAARAIQRVDGQTASINGATQVRAGALRPELIAPMAAEGIEGDAASHVLTVGAKIRLIREPYFGLLGVVCKLPHELVQIDTGAFVRTLQAELKDGRTVTVPRANVELV